MKKTIIALFCWLWIATLANAQSVAPGDNLVVEGIPGIPQGLVDAIGRYAEYRTAALLGWHPRQREMLIYTRFADTDQLHRVSFPGGARTQLTFFKDKVREGIFDPVDGKYVIFTKDSGGNENYQIYRLDPVDGAVTLLTDGKSRNMDPLMAASGSRLAYVSNRRNGQDMDLYVVDPKNPASDRLLAELPGGGWEPLDWSADESRLLLLEGISINESRLWLMDAANGGKVLLAPLQKNEKNSYGDARFAGDGRRIIVSSDRGSEFLHLAAIDLQTKKETPLGTSISWDVDEFALSPNKSQVAFATNEAGNSVLRLLDLADGSREIRLPQMPVGVISDLYWHRDGGVIGFSFESPRSPRDVYTLDIAGGKFERWTTSETGGINLSGLPEPQLVRWPSFDGRSISGFLYRPPATFSGKRPLIIDIHGGPEGQARPDFPGRDNYMLNELGVAILYPNVRGSTGFGKSFALLDNGYRREDSYRDIDALLDWIKLRPDLDAERIMVTGGSYGGHMTLAIAARYSDRIRCALSVVGISNLVTFLENTSGYRRDLRRAEYGDERDPQMNAFMRRIAPLNQIEKIGKPLFIVQGANDPRVPLSEAEQMRDTLKKTGIPGWYLVAKDEGHGFIKKSNRDFQFYATVLFIREFLLK